MCLLEDGRLRLKKRDIRFEVLHTPGHTPGSVCYRHEKTLFCGDTLFYQGYGRVDLAGGNSLQMALSLKRLLKLPGDADSLPGARHENEDRLGAGGKRVRIAVHTPLPAFQNDIGDVVRLFYGEGAAVEETQQADARLTHIHEEADGEWRETFVLTDCSGRTEQNTLSAPAVSGGLEEKTPEETLD